ncbi:hypothetical protein [Arenicella xantha]|uniref:Uncharacterized protein n=1 Tax=Arenicella xantha TaxID=644221 RepID=A0A395JEJ3_9GAMM|nr:hypothetical protein [Arenicella xantha]RBP47097.1 hypothetical protein DFR28_11060 [Arenicella xantha]
MAREGLLRVVKIMFALLALAFLFILFRSLSGPPRVTNPATAFDNVQIGETALRRLGNERVWATRLSASQRSQALELSAFVHDPMSGCGATVVVCAVSVKTERAGIEIMFSAKVPPQLPNQLPWFGGFVDPNSGAVYDRLGRAYRLPTQPVFPPLQVFMTVSDNYL